MASREAGAVGDITSKPWSVLPSCGQIGFPSPGSRQKWVVLILTFRRQKVSKMFFWEKVTRELEIMETRETVFLKRALELRLVSGTR